MEMTIDKAIDIMEYYEEYGVISQRYGRNKAVEIMRKYQKITEIMNELNGNFYESYLKDRQTLEKIYEVIKDGTDDT